MATQLKQKDMRKKDNKELLKRVKERYQIMYDADHENRVTAMDDLKFTNVPGWQWDENMKQERGQRPCYEFNKLRITCKRVINDMRANRPQGKVRAVEGGDVDTAEIYEGLIRNIWNVSDGDTVIDRSADYQVAAGMGAWRLTTEYSDDTAFDQDILIEEIPNPFCLYSDPSAKDTLKRDAEDWVYTEKISFKSFEAKYGEKVEKSNFQDSVEFDDDDDWQDEETVRVAEYWWKEPTRKELWQVPGPDGEMMVVDSESDEATGIPESMIAQRREVMTDKIMWCIVSGDRVLEGPEEWAGSMFPFVVIYGEHMHIDGKPCWWGLPRFARDAQQSYNIARTAISETIAQAPQAKWWATVDQAKGNVDKWSQAHKENYPFLLYNADSKAPGPPTRMGGADVPIALIQESQLASEEIKATTGIFDPSLGAQSNETSGRAIYARQQQGEIATFNYQDNLSKGIRRTYELAIDLIPNIYDTERELRILGSDGAENYKKVNQMVMVYEEGREPYMTRINDLATGKYDVTITIGPNFATQRQEAAETYGQLGQNFPELMGVAGDLVFKSMDLPYAEDIAERLRTLLPPQIQQQLNEGQDVPPEVVEAMAQAEQAMAQVEQHGQLVQAASQELEGEKAEIEKQTANLKTELANIRAAKAEFDAHIANETAKLVSMEAGLTAKGADLTKRGAELKEAAVAKGKEEVAEVIDVAGAVQTVSAVDDILSQFMQAVDDSMGNMRAQANEIAQQANRKVVGGTARRVDGKLVADVQYNDGTSRSVSAVRKDGALQIVPEPGEEPGT